MIFRTLTRTLAVFALLLSATAYAQIDERALKANEQPGNGGIVNPRGTASYSGTNVGGPEWTRPFADGTCCSGLGPVRYSVQEFHISANSTCDIESLQNGWDGYLFIYETAFDPVNQTVNFVAGDDDGNGGIGTSNIDGVNLSSGTSYFAVTTGFENGEEGTFDNTIDCANAEVTLGGIAVFTPSQPIPADNRIALLALAALVLAAAWMARRA